MGDAKSVLAGQGSKTGLSLGMKTTPNLSGTFKTGALLSGSLLVSNTKLLHKSSLTSLKENQDRANKNQLEDKLLMKAAVPKVDLKSSLLGTGKFASSGNIPCIHKDNTM